MSEYFLQAGEGRSREIFPGVVMQGYGGQALTISVVDLEPHAIVEPHEHPHEQMGILLEGELTFTIGSETQTLRPGDVWRIPGGVRHTCQAGAMPTKALDVFTPRRDEYC